MKITLTTEETDMVADISILLGKVPGCYHAVKGCAIITWYPGDDGSLQLNTLSDEIDLMECDLSRRTMMCLKGIVADTDYTIEEYN